MYRLRVYVPTLAFWLAISFTLCVIGGLLFPGFPIPHQTLELLYPGFRWISVGSYLLGLTESLALGAYAALLLVPLHNFFARRAGQYQ